LFSSFKQLSYSDSSYVRLSLSIRSGNWIKSQKQLLAESAGKFYNITIRHGMMVKAMPITRMNDDPHFGNFIFQSQFVKLAVREQQRYIACQNIRNGFGEQEKRCKFAKLNGKCHFC
jgi:hypothetical protein